MVTWGKDGKRNRLAVWNDMCTLPYLKQITNHIGFPGASVLKKPPANAGDASSMPGSGRSPGEGNGNPFRYSCPGNPMDGRAWWAIVHRVAKSKTRLSN